jgi:hypothetical protein
LTPGAVTLARLLLEAEAEVARSALGGWFGEFVGEVVVDDRPCRLRGAGRSPTDLRPARSPQRRNGGPKRWLCCGTTGFH